MSSLDHTAGRRAVVVGGGIGGLAVGIGLHRAGWDVSVLERDGEFREVGAGVTLVRNALRALEALGVAAAVREAGQVEAAGGTRTPAGRWLWRVDRAALAEQLGTSSLGIHRATLHRILRDALPPEALQSGAEVVSIAPGGQDRRAEVRVRRAGQEKTEAADLVVAADGLRSRTRTQLWPGADRPSYLGSTAWRGVTAAPWAGTVPVPATITWGPGAEFGTFPLGDGRIYWYGAVIAPAGDRAADEAAEVRRRFGSWHEPIAALLDATDPHEVLRHDLFDLVKPMSTYVAGRVGLLGDAAHAMPPYLGQGACQALEDAVVLSVVVHPDAVTEGLRRYDAERRPRTQLIARTSRRVGRFGQQMSLPLAVGVRNTVLRLTPPRAGLAAVAKLTDWHPPSPPPRSA